MAIDLTLKSVQLTNRDSSPVALNSPGLGGVSSPVTVFGHIASVTAALSATSVIRLVQVPAHCRVKTVKLYSGAQAAGAADFGVYRTGADGGTVADADLFGSAVSVASAVLGTDITHESTIYTLAKFLQPLWQAAGISTEPPKGTVLDIAATITTDITTGLQPLAIEVTYVM